MRKIGVIANLSKDPKAEKSKLVIDEITKRNLEVLVQSDIYKHLGEGTLLSEYEFYQLTDMIFVLGGDGTLLQAARNAARYNCPILGINLGRLGFLTEIEIGDIGFAIDNIINNNYTIDNRMMLKSILIRNDKVIDEFTALNDIAIAKSSFARIIHLEAYINGEFVNYYPADGILVSSPTGSTAYSLSAGGPVIHSGMECLLLTPICPHIMNSRAIITDSDSEIIVSIIDENRDILLTIDGQEAVKLHQGDHIKIVKSPFKTNLIRIRNHNFFGLLRNKLSERLSAYHELEEDNKYEA